MPMPIPLAVTVAPATTAPVGSVTVPERSAAATCDCARPETANTMTAAKRIMAFGKTRTTNALIIISFELLTEILFAGRCWKKRAMAAPRPLISFLRAREFAKRL
jgi:hypothetical protein